MADRMKGFVVTFEEDLKGEQLEQVKNALLQIKGVITVDPVVTRIDDLMNRQRIRYELSTKLWQVLKEEPSGR